MIRSPFAAKLCSPAARAALLLVGLMSASTPLPRMRLRGKISEYDTPPKTQLLPFGDSQMVPLEDAQACETLTFLSDNEADDADYGVASDDDRNVGFQLPFADDIPAAQSVDDDVPAAQRESPGADEVPDELESDVDRAAVMDSVENHARTQRPLLTTKTMVGDGNCLFRAAADQMYDDQERHGDTRLLAVTHIAEGHEHYSAFFDDEENIDDWLVRMSRAHQWGDSHAIQALADKTAVPRFCVLPTE